MASKARISIEVLDRTRPYGDIYGEHPHNAKYSQNAKGLEGWLYDAHYRLIEAALNEKQKAVLKRLREQAAAKPAEQRAPVETDPDKVAIASDDDELEPDARVSDDDGVNLELWLRGEERYKATDIQKALKARFGVNKPGTVAQALYLVEEKNLIPRAEVHSSILPPAQP